MIDSPTAIAGRLKALIAVAGAMLAAFVLLQAIVFRSGLYWPAAQRDSNLGAVMRALTVVEAAWRPRHRTVLVLGDSRIGEGFSGPLASAGGDVDFIGVAVPGSTPRTWYYLLREIGRRGVRYEAVLIGTPYRSTDALPTRDSPLDPPHHIALVGLRDLPGYAHEAGAGEPRRRAWLAVLLPELVAQQDLRDLLRHPLLRLHHWRQRGRYLADTIHYPGRDNRIGDDARAVARPSPVADAVVRENAAYLDHWMTRIGALAARSGARTIAFQVPRGPYVELLPPRDAPTWTGVRTLPPDLLAELETPRYFFDLLHLNRAGRERMSVLLGERVRAELDAKPH